MDGWMDGYDCAQKNKHGHFTLDQYQLQMFANKCRDLNARGCKKNKNLRCKLGGGSGEWAWMNPGLG